MPGTRLNDTERRLREKWNNGRGLNPNTLKKIKIAGDPGLRGIKSLELEFKYPLTVICGRNGSGKTTSLAIAALGFHAAPNHLPRGAKLSTYPNRTTAHLTFSDFFFKGPSDPDISGVTISWTFQDGNTLSITKGVKKWMHYERRPARAVHYLGIARTLPAIEQNVLKHRFKPSRTHSNSVPINTQYRTRLNDIMGRSYSAATEIASDSYRLRTCNSSSTASYSSFNMGAGEDILIDILGTLQSTPANSLVVIEEIELGLHPAALVSLAKHLQEIIAEKNLQILVSTHSREFLNAVPSEARILIQAGATEHHVTYSPTTEFAMGTICGQAEPELFIYCEDDFAQELLTRSLSSEQRQRSRIIPIGAKAELAKQALFHIRTGLREKHIVIWDGDVKDTEVRNWLNSNCDNEAIRNQVSFSFIQGEFAPEVEIVSILQSESGINQLVQEFDFDSDAQAENLLSELQAVQDHHNIPYIASQSLNIDEVEVIKTLVRSAKITDRTLFDHLSSIVQNALSGTLLTGRV